MTERSNASTPDHPEPPAEDLGNAGAAAKELSDMLHAAYTDRENRIHAETIIGGAAALTGEFGLRASGVPLPKGGFVLGDPINEILYEGAQNGRLTFWEVLKKSAAEAGLAPADLPDPIAIFRRTAETMAVIAKGGNGKSPIIPPLTVPPDNYPQEWSPNACPRLRERVKAIGESHHLTPRQLAFALVNATGDLIKEARGVLAPAIAVRLAAEIMFCTAKMAPITKPIV